MLIGPMGAGKYTIGRLLAARLRVPFVVTNTFINKAICSGSPGGLSARRIGASIARAMVSRCNAAAGRPAARPEGVSQTARLHVTALGKGTTIPCAPRLDPNRLWGSACSFIYEGISMEELIEIRAKKSIARIFEEDGECIFRALEGEALEGVCSSDSSQVIATGWGTVISAPNRQRMKACGKVMWLDARPETPAARMQCSARRLLPKGEGSLRRQYRPMYEQCANLRLNRDHMGVE